MVQMIGGEYPGSLSAYTNVWTPTSAEIQHPFWLFDWNEVYHQEVLVCSVVLFFSAILCSAAGIGGGGIYVAVLMVCGRLTPHNAVPLSKAIVFFGAISSLVVNVYRAIVPVGGHAPKNVIDVPACRLVVPATLIGTFLGVLLNRRTSDYTIVIMLTGLLGLMTGMVTQMARKQMVEERELTAAAARRAAAASDSATAETALLPAPAAVDEAAEPRGAAQPLEAAAPSSKMPPGGGAAAAADRDCERRPLLAEALSTAVPQPKIIRPTTGDATLAGLLLCIVVLGGIFRFHMHACKAEVDGDTTKIGACNHPVNLIFHHNIETWMRNPTVSVILEQLVWSLPMWTCVAVTAYYGFVANREVGWPPRDIVLYQAVAVLTGLLAGLVGVGGGLIFSPFFLLIGMDPAIAVGTSATCVLFTSSSTTMQYVFTDRIIMSLAIVYGLVNMVASCLGTCLVHFIQDRFARKSYITSIVAIGVAISAMLSVAKFIYLVADPKEDL